MNSESMSHSDLRALVERYRPLSDTGLSATDFHRRARDDGVAALNAIVLLRDLYGLNLAECKLIHGNYDTDQSNETLTES